MADDIKNTNPVEEATGAKAKRQPRILLVDDDPNLLDALRRTLHKDRFKIQCANSADEALQHLREKKFDVIITDQQMPGTNGIELLAQISAKYPTMIRFILTGNATMDLILEAINKGHVSRFFVKPCNGYEIAASIRQELSRKELMEKSQKLIAKSRQQDDLLSQLERKNPGITKVDRDEDGSIILKEPTGDINVILREMDSLLSNDDEDD
ncbi:response regulator [Candidatus Sumerlaeota bacterium]|nr:response regulator [Candidatus Sumerlaeota bacterium]